ncbi:hypothetical protein [Pelosinus propionicus]|uniref:Uncharacterized protein n=1 Tax=Pelosinus propionicus DSM 13327 TaxID=1123291 RepID=A0A1I4LBE0_9FIRM|nr:hypothetical protein [Pelosinus propionicus]SFL88189.1 hypothetical protein SAMN04490355_102380 [Pelosinus propionicus DSM 13327]
MNIIQRKKVAVNSIKITYGGRKDNSKQASVQIDKTQSKSKNP